MWVYAINLTPAQPLHFSLSQGLSDTTNENHHRYTFFPPSHSMRFNTHWTAATQKLGCFCERPQPQGKSLEAQVLAGLSNLFNQCIFIYALCLPPGSVSIVFARTLKRALWIISYTHSLPPWFTFHMRVQGTIWRIAQITLFTECLMCVHSMQSSNHKFTQRTLYCVSMRVQKSNAQCF